MPAQLRVFLWMAALAGIALSGCAGAYSSGNGKGNGGGAGVPPAPTGLQTSAGNAQVRLSWSVSANAAGYYVKRSTTSGGLYTQIAGTSSTSFSDTGVTNGTQYFYVVSSYNSAGQSANSTEASAAPSATVTIPSTPSGLQAAAGNAQVSLTWNASGGATSYNLKRATTAGGPYATIGSSTISSFMNTGLTNGARYFYVVSALNSAGESANSVEVNATPTAPVTPPAAPTGLQATTGNAQVSLNWSASAGATSYYVKRGTTGGGPYSQVAAPTVTSFTDAGLTDGVTYYYVVSALNTAGESADSTQASATPAGMAPDVIITIDPTKTKPISPFIYGINFYNGVSGAPPLLTFDRAGGNRWTAYNWETNASNAGSDYIYDNDNYLSGSNVPAEAVRSFVAGDQGAGLASLVTFQLQGYAAADGAGTVDVTQPLATRLAA